MDELQVTLFGRPSVRWAGDEVAGLEAKKVLELFAYLLVNRARTHSREVLAELLWGEKAPAQSRKYLRQALWQLQGALERTSGVGGSQWLDVDPEWVRLATSSRLWLDVAEFERAYEGLEGAGGQAQEDAHSGVLEQAVQLYRGDFLEGCYQDWCIFERERLQNIYLAMLDTLTQCCEAQRRYEAGLAYGAQALRTDRARERTHRRMMRLYYLAGDRTAALRQFEQLSATLKAELDVMPSRRTLALWEQIRADRLDDSPPSTPSGKKAGAETPLTREPAPSIHDALLRLKQLQAALAIIQRQVRQEIETLEVAIADAAPCG